MHARTFLPPKSPRPRQAVRWHIGTGAVSVRGIACTCVENTTAGYVFARVDNPKITFPLTVAEFDEIKDLESFCYDRTGMDAETSHAVLHSGVRSLSDLPKEQRHYVNWKVTACRKFLHMENTGFATRGDVGMPIALAAIQKELDGHAGDAIRDGKRKRGGRQPKTGYTLVGAHQFRIWLERYEKSGPLGLVEHYHLCGNRNPRYTPDEYDILFQYVWKYLSPERPYVATLHAQMDAQINGGVGVEGLNAERRRKGKPDLRVPHIDTLRKEIRRLPAFDVMAARYSEAEAINFFRAARGGVPDLVKPMQRIEADEWKTHLHTLLIEARLWEAVRPDLQEKSRIRVCLAAAICCTTRCIVGLAVSPESNSANTRMLLRLSLSDKTALGRYVGAVTPWEYRALADELAVDEGPANINSDTEMLCADLEIGFKVPQAEMPRQRGKMERFFRTLDIRALVRFSGRAFSNAAIKKKYDALARACVTVDELCALIVRFIVDEYHNTPHGGLNGEMPRACWLRLTKKKPPTVPPGPAKIRNVFGYDIKATLESSGIRVFGNWYWSPSLQKIFETLGRAEVTVRVDTENLGAVSVRRPDGWLSVVGPDFMDGVPLQVWEAANESLRRQNGAMAAMAKPVVRGAIAYAMKADQETRKRLLIQYRPMTAEDLARARRKMWIGVPATDNPDRTPELRTDLFEGSLPTLGGRRPKRGKQTSARDTPQPPAKLRRKSRGRSQPPSEPAPKPGRRWAFRGK